MGYIKVMRAAVSIEKNVLGLLQEKPPVIRTNCRETCLPRIQEVQARIPGRTLNSKQMSYPAQESG
jgi:hypothetical protein